MDLTIVITTRNRPEKMIRALSFLILSKFKGKILIGDASNYDDSKLTKDFLESSNFNYLYFHNEGMSVNDFHHFLSKKITTKYSLCIADGALVIVDGIKECIKTLEKKTNLLAVSGKTFNYIYSKKYNFRISHYAMPIVKETNSLERVKNICSNYRVPMYCVMHSKTWVKMWEGLDDIKVHILAAEVIPTIRLVIEGKIDQINTPFLLREMHSKRTMITQENLYLHQHFKETYDLCIELINKEIKTKKSSSISKSKTRELFDMLLNLENEEPKKKNYLDSFLRNLFTIFTSLKFINNFVLIIKINRFQNRFFWIEEDKNKLLQTIRFIRQYRE